MAKQRTTAKLKEITEIPNQEKIDMENSYSFIKQAIRELTQEEIEFLKSCQETDRINDTCAFLKIYNEVYQRAIQPCNCGSLYSDLARQLFTQMKYQLL